jgi:hypothetical protein
LRIVFRSADSIFQPMMDFRPRESPLAGYLAPRKFAPLCQPKHLLGGQVEIPGQTGYVKISMGHKGIKSFRILIDPGSPVEPFPKDNHP